MSLPSKTTQEISDTIIAQLQGSLGQTIPFLPKSFIRVLAKVLAGVFVLLYKYCGFIFLQLFVAYATDQPTTINGQLVSPLVAWGRLIGEGDPEPALQAELRVELTVELQSGTLKSGWSLVRSETGVVYQTVAEVLLDAPTVQVTMRAVSDQAGGDGSGSIGNLQPGDKVDFANPPPNVVSVAKVLSATVTGSDAETTESYRARITKRFQAKPQGGAYADYRAWAQAVPGIVAVYPYAGNPGEVDVFVEASIDSSGSPDGIVTGAQLTAVSDAIELDVDGVASLRPVNAAVNVYAIKRSAFDVNVVALETPSEVETKAAILAGVDEYFRSLEPFIVGLSVLPRKDRVTQAAMSAVVDGIVSAAGGTVSSVSLIEGGQPIPARSLSPGEKAKVGTVTYG